MQRADFRVMRSTTAIHENTVKTTVETRCDAKAQRGGDSVRSKLYVLLTRETWNVEQMEVSNESFVPAWHSSLTRNQKSPNVERR